MHITEEEISISCDQYEDAFYACYEYGLEFTAQGSWYVTEDEYDYWTFVRFNDDKLACIVQVECYDFYHDSVEDYLTPRSEYGMNAFSVEALADSYDIVADCIEIMTVGNADFFMCDVTSLYTDEYEGISEAVLFSRFDDGICYNFFFMYYDSCTEQEYADFAEMLASAKLDGMQDEDILEYEAQERQYALECIEEERQQELERQELEKYDLASKIITVILVVIICVVFWRVAEKGEDGAPISTVIAYIILAIPFVLPIIIGLLLLIC